MTDPQCTTSQVPYFAFLSQLSGHSRSLGVMPINGKNSLNLFYSGTIRPLALGLGM